MKKLLITIALLSILAVLVFPQRPTNEWIIRFDDNQAVLIEADSIDEALKIFTNDYKFEYIFSASRRSFVYSEWIWCGACETKLEDYLR